MAEQKLQSPFELLDSDADQKTRKAYFESLKEAAVTDGVNSDAHYYLGLCYQHGIGVRKNSRKAAETFNESKDPRQLIQLYELTAQGKGLVRGTDEELLSICKRILRLPVTAASTRYVIRLKEAQKKDPKSIPESDIPDDVRYSVGKAIYFLFRNKTFEGKQKELDQLKTAFYLGSAQAGSKLVKYYQKLDSKQNKIFEDAQIEWINNVARMSLNQDPDHNKAVLNVNIELANYYSSNQQYKSAIPYFERIAQYLNPLGDLMLGYDDATVVQQAASIAKFIASLPKNSSTQPSKDMYILAAKNYENKFDVTRKPENLKSAGDYFLKAIEMVQKNYHDLPARNKPEFKKAYDEEIQQLFDNAATCYRVAIKYGNKEAKEVLAKLIRNKAVQSESKKETSYANEPVEKYKEQLLSKRHERLLEKSKNYNKAFALETEFNKNPIPSHAYKLAEAAELYLTVAEGKEQFVASAQDELRVRAISLLRHAVDAFENPEAAKILFEKTQEVISSSENQSSELDRLKLIGDDNYQQARDAERQYEKSHQKEPKYLLKAAKNYLEAADKKDLSRLREDLIKSASTLLRLAVRKHQHYASAFLLKGKIEKGLIEKTNSKELKQLEKLMYKQLDKPIDKYYEKKEKEQQKAIKKAERQTRAVKTLSGDEVKSGDKKVAESSQQEQSRTVHGGEGGSQPPETPGAGEPPSTPSADQ